MDKFLDYKTIVSNDFVFYEKREMNDSGYESIYVLQGVKNGKQIHVHQGLNQFSKELNDVPNDYVKSQSPDDSWIREFFWNPDAVPLEQKQVPEYDQPFYFIHENGRRPFVVYLDDYVATIYKLPENTFHIGKIDLSRPYYHQLVKKVRFQESFIGVSPFNDMTDFSGGHGEEFNGNTILLRLKDLTYFYIGPCIYTFEALSPIVFYESSVGNNDVPYPYARDDHDRYYIMLDRVIMKRNNFGTHPYHEYYDKVEILAHGCVNFPDKRFKNFKGLYIGEDPYMLTWTPRVKDEWDHLTHFEVKENGLGEPLFLRTLDDKMIPLTFDLFKDLMDSYGKEQELQEFKTKIDP